MQSLKAVQPPPDPRWTSANPYLYWAVQRPESKSPSPNHPGWDVSLRLTSPQPAPSFLAFRQLQPRSFVSEPSFLAFSRPGLQNSSFEDEIRDHRLQYCREPQPGRARGSPQPRPCSSSRPPRPMGYQLRITGSFAQEFVGWSVADVRDHDKVVHLDRGYVPQDTSNTPLEWLECCMRRK
jgi:hypothetical protein